MLSGSCAYGPVKYKGLYQWNIVVVVSYFLSALAGCFSTN